MEWYKILAEIEICSQTKEDAAWIVQNLADVPYIYSVRLIDEDDNCAELESRLMYANTDIDHLIEVHNDHMIKCGGELWKPRV